MKNAAIPPHLSATSKALWARLATEFSLDDGAAESLLRALCEARDRGEQARLRIERDGAYVKDRFKQLKPHPALNIERDCRGQVLAAIRGLRLAPEDVE
jgi:phage terminase small subunit